MGGEQQERRGGMQNSQLRMAKRHRKKWRTRGQPRRNFVERGFGQGGGNQALALSEE
jgi:hypothetical protein